MEESEQMSADVTIEEQATAAVEYIWSRCSICNKLTTINSKTMKCGKCEGKTTA